MLEDSDEEGLVSLQVPPISRDFSVERLWDPDVQLAAGKRGEKRVNKHRKCD